MVRLPFLVSASLLLAFAASAQELHTRNQPAPQNEPPQNYEVQSAPNEVHPGYTFLITLEDPVDTASAARGKHFRAILREPIVTADGRTIAGGSMVTGHVSEVERGFNARLLLSFDEIQSPQGWLPLSATVVEVPSEHGLKPIGPEGQIERKPIDVRRALEGAGVGAVVGASAGSASGGGKGAAVGAASGAVAGASVATLSDRNILLDKGAQLVLRLDRGILLP